MQGDIPDNVAQMVAVSVQAALYLPYIWTFGFCLHRFLRSSSGWKPFRDIDRTVVLLASVLWLIATINLGLGILRLVRDISCPVGSERLGEGSISTVKAALVSLQVLIADGIMVWRFWIIYRRSWARAIIPCLLWLGCWGMVIWVLCLQLLASVRRRAWSLTAALHISGTVFYGLTLLLNAYATCGIAWRIWRAEEETRASFRESGILNILNPSESVLRKTLKVVIESGLIYSLTSVSVFISHLLESNVKFIASAMAIVLIGLMFNLIALRIASRTRREEEARVPGHGSSVQFEFVAQTQLSQTRDSFDDSLR